MSVPTIPPPSRMLFGEDFMQQMRQQLFSVRYRHQPDPEYPGWTFSDETQADETYLRFDHDGTYWIYRLAPSSIPGQLLGVWPD